MANYDCINSLNVKNKKLVCPHCNSSDCVKNGKNKDKQKFLCKNCRKSFISDTNTPIYYSKKSNSIWNKYLDCLLKQYSLRKTASICHIALSTAFYWRHKILDAITQNSNPDTLNENIICDRSLFYISYKGNHKKSNFSMPRKSYKKGRRSIYTSYLHNHIFVLTALDNNNKIFVAPVPSIRLGDVKRALTNKISEKSSFISNTFFSYKFMHRFFKVKKVKALDFTSKAKIRNLQNGIINFLHPYRGVATKYLYNYLSLFHYIFNKTTVNLLKIKGKKAFKISNFKDRLPIFA